MDTEIISSNTNRRDSITNDIRMLRQSGYQNKFTYFIRTIPGFERYLQPIEDVMRHQFIPAITGGKTINDNERELLALPPNWVVLDSKTFVWQHQSSTTTHKP